MKFTINREVFLLPLQQIVNVIEKRQTMPILSNILLTMNAGILTLTGSDLEIQLVADIKIEETENSAITVPARKILDIIRLLPPESKINIELNKDKLKIVSGRSRFSLTTLEAINYPAFDEKNLHTTLSMPIAQLNKALSKSLFCMGNQDVRYYLNGILVTITNQQLKIVASDGHRLALYNEPLTEANEIEASFIIPRKGVIELSRLMSDSEQLLSLQLSASNVRLDFEKLSFSVKLIDAKYPDFSKVFQQEFKSIIPVNRKDLKDALTRVSILSNEKFKGVRIEATNETIVLSSENPEQEEAKETIEHQSGSAEQNKVIAGFNAGYLIEAINACSGEEIVMGLNGPKESQEKSAARKTKTEGTLIFSPSDSNTKYVVMPYNL